MNNKTRNKLADSGLQALKHAVLQVLYEERLRSPIPQRIIRDQLEIQRVKEYPEGANQLIYGILASLGADGHAVHHLNIGWSITEKGISAIEN